MLARKQEQTIAALLTQRNLDEAAKAAGISMRTLMRWLKLPEFRGAYREARRTAYSQAVAKLQQGAPAAATTLLKVMLDQTTPASVKVRAAECVMSHSSKAIEIEDVEFRVAELERAAEAPEEETMKAALLARLKRLEEVRPVDPRPPEFHIGYLKELAPDYTGGRHVVTVGCDADGLYRREERPGPEPDEYKSNSLLPIRVIVASPENEPAMLGV